MTTFTLSFSEPSLVAEAPAEENPWGFFQFPKLTKLPDETLLLSFQVGEDTCRTYGTCGFRSFVSQDATNWSELPLDKSEELRPFHQSVPVSNGERLSPRTPPAHKLEELDLPPAVSHGMAGYDNMTLPGSFFAWKELPEHLRCLPLNLLEQGAQQWQQTCAPLDLPNDLRRSGGAYLPFIFFGDLRKASDGSLWMGTYPNYTLRQDQSVDSKCSVAFIRSQDNGNTWSLVGRLHYQPDLDYDPLGHLRAGFTEPTFLLLGGNEVLCIARTTDATPGLAPLYEARSFDGGQSFTTPRPIAPYGVDPHLLKLESGHLILSSGRPGVEVRVSQDPTGRKWSGPTHLVHGSIQRPRDHSCGYTSLLATGDNSFLVAYSEFYRVGRSDKWMKAILAVRGTIQSQNTSSVSASLIGEDHQMVRNPGSSGNPLLEFPINSKGEVNGVCKAYYVTGELAAETPMRSSVPHGYQRVYRRDGTLISELLFDEGLPLMRRLYDSLGNLTLERFR